MNLELLSNAEGNTSGLDVICCYIAVAVTEQLE